MNIKEEFFLLKEQWKKAKGAEREEIDRKLDAFYNSLTDEDALLIQEAVNEDFKQMHEEIADIKKTYTARDLMAPVLPYISVSALAKEYFGKSASWFYQRLNGNMIHGKAAAFTDEELVKLTKALDDIANKLHQAALAVA